MIADDQNDEKLLIFPVGKFIAVYSIEKNDMNFIKLSPNLEQIVSMTISPNKKFIAVCEKYQQ